MKLYLLSQNVNKGYCTFDACDGFGIPKSIGEVKIENGRYDDWLICQDFILISLGDER